MTTGNARIAQMKEIESAYEFYHPVNKKTHKPKKSYIFMKKLRDLVEPSKSNCGGAHNTKNIQSMIWYLQAKFKHKEGKCHYTVFETEYYIASYPLKK